MDNVELSKKEMQLVVKSNDLIQKTRYNLTSTQQKFVAYLVSLIRPTDTELQEYEIRVEDFCLLTGINKSNFYTDFKEMIDDFVMNRSFWVETEDELYKFYWFSDTTYLKGRGTLKVTLSKRLTKYLIGLSKNFTSYQLWQVLGLKGKYSIRLFELFASYEYRHKKEFEINELKELLCANIESYKNFYNFKVKVLDSAIKEVNEFTELQVKYKEVKKGRKVIKIIFIINKKETLETYKGYIKTIEKLNERRGQIEGQLSLFDLDVEGLEHE